MKLGLLQRKHPEYSAATLRLHSDLFAGGEQFRKSIVKYLLPNDVEPLDLYKRRCEHAHYVNYAGPICGYFGSLLFSSPPSMTSDPSEVDGFYSRFKEDCDGRGSDLDQFFYGRFVEALKHRRSFWRVEFPAPDRPIVTRQDWIDADAGRAILVPIDSADVANWKCDGDGVVWLLEATHREELGDLSHETLTCSDTFTEWRRDGQHRRWQIVYPKGKKPDASTDVPEIEPPVDVAGRLPVVELCLPPQLWAMNLIADSQLEHFRQRNALSWAIKRTCYAMPAFFLADGRKPPKMGAGYYLQLAAEDKVEYPSPPSAPFQVISEYVKSLKDEIYRVTHQLAAGVDNNTAAVGRSWHSKEADASLTEVVLLTYGALVREAIERTLQIVSSGRSDEIKWHVGGMDGYSLDDAPTIAKAVGEGQKLQIQSLTYHRQAAKRVALAMLPGAEERTKQQIAAEIDANTNQIPVPVGATGLGMAGETPEAPEEPGDDEGDDASMTTLPKEPTQ